MNIMCLLLDLEPVLTRIVRVGKDSTYDGTVLDNFPMDHCRTMAIETMMVQQ